jgi:hypothetical protein
MWFGLPSTLPPRLLGGRHGCTLNIFSTLIKFMIAPGPHPVQPAVLTDRAKHMSRQASAGRQPEKITASGRWRIYDTR